MTTPKLVERDARNRGFRTALQILVIEVVVVVLPLVMDALEGEDMVEWDRLWRSALRAALGAVLAYVMRRAWSPSETPPPVPAPEDGGDHAHLGA